MTAATATVENDDFGDLDVAPEQDVRFTRPEKPNPFVKHLEKLVPDSGKGFSFKVNPDIPESRYSAQLTKAGDKLGVTVRRQFRDDPDGKGGTERRCHVKATTKVHKGQRREQDGE